MSINLIFKVDEETVAMAVSETVLNLGQKLMLCGKVARVISIMSKDNENTEIGCCWVEDVSASEKAFVMYQQENLDLVFTGGLVDLINSRHILFDKPRYCTWPVRRFGEDSWVRDKFLGEGEPSEYTVKVECLNKWPKISKEMIEQHQEAEQKYWVELRSLQSGKTYAQDRKDFYNTALGEAWEAKDD